MKLAKVAREIVRWREKVPAELSPSSHGPGLGVNRVEHRRVKASRLGGNGIHWLGAAAMRAPRPSVALGAGILLLARVVMALASLIALLIERRHRTAATNY